MKANVTDFTDYTIRGVCVRHEIHDGRDCFLHRLSIGKKQGLWSGYAAIARLDWRGKEFAATTDYYLGVLPIVFEIVS